MATAIGDTVVHHGKGSASDAEDQTVPGDHIHPWPRNEAGWVEIRKCRQCGDMLLRQFVKSSSWVVRRVERIAFIDDRTVRRRVSVDYLAPTPAVALEAHGGPPVRVLPLAIMRRKSLVNFDLVRHDGQPISLVGLRENQAFTAAITRESALAVLRRHDRAPTLGPSVEDFLEGLVAGEQSELNEAYATVRRASATDQLGILRSDPWFRAVMDRLADSFILFALDSSAYPGRQVVKFAYDEPLTLRYREAGYRHVDAGESKPNTSRSPWYHAPDDAVEQAVPTYVEGDYLDRWRRAPLLAHLGLTPTLIRFPVPAAELATSFHFEVEAPPEVSIVKAKLLAGRPNAVKPGDVAQTEEITRREARRREAEWLPAFDMVQGGCATIDLHVTDVPYGSLARAQVALQPSPKGWLSTAVLGCLISSATLGIAWAAPNARSDIGSTLMVTFAAALVALLARPDPHRMITRLLATIRQLAAVSAVLTFAGALTFAFVSRTDARPVLGGLAAASLVPTVLSLAAWATAMKRSQPKAQRSPWEQHRPRKEQDETIDRDARESVEIMTACRLAARPYDTAVERLRFGQPAIKVASSEGCRRRFELESRFLADLDRHDSAAVE